MNNIKLQCQSIYDELQYLKSCRDLHLNKSRQPASDELIEYLKNDLEELNKLIEKLEQKLAACQNA
jgi:hypothetical protein